MNVMLKILLSIGLLGVVVGVSYLKTVPSERGASVVEPMVEPVAATDAVQLDASKDSVVLSSVVADDADEAQLEAKGSSAIPPLLDEFPTKVMALSSEQVTDTVTERKKSESGVSVSEANSAKVEASSNSDEANREEQIVLYFQRKLKALPDDLSSYEKKVAIKEVRDETCELFHISRVKLSQLARVHKISYP